MSTITFENGVRVNFNGTPTSQDVEEVARQLGISGGPFKETDNRDLLDKSTSIFNKIFPGGKVGEAIGTLGGYGLTALKERMGLVPKGTTSQYDLSSASPLQVVGDIAQGAATVAGLKAPLPKTILGKASQFAKIGALAGAGSAASEKKDIVGGATRGAIGGAITGGAVGVVDKGFRLLGNLFGKAGDKITTTVIKPSKVDMDDGFSLETIKKYDLGGSLKKSFNKTEAKLDELSKTLNTKLSSSGASINLNDVYEKTLKRVLGNKLESFGSNLQMDSAIERLRNEIVSVSGENGILSIPQAQIVKRAAGHFGAWTYGIPTPESTASQKLYNVFYNELKTVIENSSPSGVKEINKEISKLIPIMNALIRRIPIAERNNALSLTDIISLTGAAINPPALGITLLNLASKSGTVGAALGKTAPKIGEGIGKTVSTGARAILPFTQ